MFKGGVFAPLIHILNRSVDANIPALIPVDSLVDGLG